MHGRKKRRRSLATFLLELLVYTALVFVYLALVMHFQGDWVSRIYNHHRRWYAVLAIALIIGQAVVLETVTTALLRRIGKKGG